MIKTALLIAALAVAGVTMTSEANAQYYGPQSNQYYGPQENMIGGIGRQMLDRLRHQHRRLPVRRIAGPPIQGQQVFVEHPPGLKGQYRCNVATGKDTGGPGTGDGYCVRH